MSGGSGRYDVYDRPGSPWRLDVVRGATVLVVGAGALGNEVLKNLALLGVGRVVVVDRDAVEASNLTRSVLFRPADAGRPKAVVATERVADLNPDVAVVPLVGELESVVGLGLVRRVGAVVGCLDNRLARHALNELCQWAGVAWVDGATEALAGEVAVYDADAGPCYACTLGRADWQALAETRSCQGLALADLSAGRVPTTAPMASIVAAWQVQEVMKLLHRDRVHSLAGRRLVIDGLRNDVYMTSFDRMLDCPAHNRVGPVVAVSEWCARGTSARDVLGRLGSDGFVRLRREAVVAAACPGCGWREAFRPALAALTPARAACPHCGTVRVPEAVYDVAAGDEWAGWPLRELGVPAWDVIEARVSDECAVWYELGGDVIF